MVRFLTAMMLADRWMNNPANNNALIALGTKVSGEDQAAVAYAVKFLQASKTWPDGAGLDPAAVNYTAGILAKYKDIPTPADLQPDRRSPVRQRGRGQAGLLVSGPGIAAGADGGQAPVGLAAVGLGRWARVMAQAYAGSPLVELRTCYTRNPERRQAFAADFGCGQDESLEALLDRDDVDGIVITAPNDQHAPIIEAAAAARQARVHRETGRGGPGRPAPDPGRGARLGDRVRLRAQRPAPVRAAGA